MTPAVAGRLSLSAGENAQLWPPEMAWTVPGYSKKKVNWAGEMLVSEPPLRESEPTEAEEIEYNEQVEKYGDALDIVNNWRSSHNFPLNTFHVGLKRRAKLIDPGCVTAQRIKRLSSIEAKLERFPTMTLSQMQDIGGCRGNCIVMRSGETACSKLFR